MAASKRFVEKVRLGASPARSDGVKVMKDFVRIGGHDAVCYPTVCAPASIASTDPAS